MSLPPRGGVERRRDRTSDRRLRSRPGDLALLRTSLSPTRIRPPPDMTGPVASLWYPARRRLPSRSLEWRSAHHFLNVSLVGVHRDVAGPVAAELVVDDDRQSPRAN